MPDGAIRNAFFPGAALLALGLLFFLWPVAHTISARYVLLLVALLLCGYLTYAAGGGLHEILFQRLRAPTLACLLLTAWICIVAIAVSPETQWSLREIAGQWMTGLLALLLGVLAAMLTGKGVFGKLTLLRLVCFLLLLHVLHIDFAGIAGLWQNGELTRPQLELAAGAQNAVYVPGLTTGPDNDSYLTNMLLGILVAEALYRGVRKLRHLPVGNIVLAGMICAALFSAYLEARRNGLIGLVFLLVFAALYWLVEGRRALPGKTVALAVVLALGLTSLAAYVGYRTDPRWRGLQETIPLAWDTENQRAWLDSGRYPLPLLSSGKPVADSNYKRIAFLKEGAKLVRDHPLGLGYGRDAFQHGIIQKYGAAKLGHSHSGYLDLAIGIGIPGVLLWLAFMGSLLRLAYRGHGENPNMFALLLFILVVDFNLRMLVDSINRDHSLQQFLFLAGLYASMAQAQRRLGAAA